MQKYFSLSWNAPNNSIINDYIIEYIKTNPSDTPPGVFALSGAGDVNVNGCYLQAGTYNGFPYYTNGSMFVFAGTYWVIDSALVIREPRYFAPSPSPGSSSISGVSLFFPFNGPSPAPTITHGKCYDQAWKIYNDGVNIETTGIVTGLDPCSYYRFRVAAQNSKGKSSYNSTGSEFILSTLPGTPTGLTAIAGNQHLKLGWSIPDNGGCSINDYIIEYYTDSEVVNYINTNGNNNEYILFGLTNNQPHSIRVAAINIAGTGLYSPALTGVIPLL